MDQILKIVEIVGKAGNRMLIALCVGAFVAGVVIPSKTWVDEPVWAAAASVIAAALSMLILNFLKLGWDLWTMRRQKLQAKVEVLAGLTHVERAFLAALSDPDFGSGAIFWMDDPALEKLQARNIIQVLRRNDGSDIHRYELLGWVRDVMKHKRLRNRLLRGAKGEGIRLQSMTFHELRDDSLAPGEEEPPYY